MEQAQRRIPVQYAKRMVGRRMYGGTSTYIPLKVNQAGVIPVIFASSLLYLPQLHLEPVDHEQHQLVRSGSWHNAPGQPAASWVNITLYFLLILFFTYFYVSITFNPTQVADDMKKYGGFVQGIRPGKPTAQYFDYILSAASPFPARSTSASSPSCRTCSSTWSAATSRTSRSVAPRC